LLQLGRLKSSFKIPSESSNSARRPANIPLHTFSSSRRPHVGNRSEHRPSSTDPAATDESQEKRLLSPEDDYDFDDDESFSLCSDSCDIVDQLSKPSNNQQQSHSGERKKKRVHYHPDEADSDNEKHPGVVKRKEDIIIPTPLPRRLSLGERLLVRIMAPTDGPSRLHGLHGKKLMSVVLV
jgi:hypothetical protein